MKIQSLNGIWARKVGGGVEEACTVPYSTLPVGRSTCSRGFSAEEGHKRIFLRFDGITYHAEVSLNGEYLGEMLPYCQYEFEITDKVTATDNRLSLELEDINLSFGPTPGWENYGGIIRGVSLIYRDDNYIEDVFFKSELTNNYRDADVKVEVQTRTPCDNVKIELISTDGNSVACYTQKSGVTEKVRLTGVSLWSPDSPILYTLKVTLDDKDSFDVYECKVGFRELKCERHRFLLNGKPIFLKGVCKHEFIGDSGHVVSSEQIEKDLKTIKSTGSNFVRLVHYPHCKETLDIADRLGLMVSEEPGLWWSDTSDEDVSLGSLGVLEKTIHRDRNHPSIVFWLCFNECKFTEKFLVDSAELCRKHDPTRLVSGANCMSDEDTLIYYNKCNFDFYTMHPYSATFERSEKSARILHDKPLVFTEWGGYFVFDNLPYMRECLQKMGALYRANSDEGALAGAFLWCWADVNDFNRGAPCVDGLLPEGLVTKNRQKHICYDLFCEEISKIEEEPISPYSYNQLLDVGGKPLTLVSDKGDISALVNAIDDEERALPFRAPQRRRKITTPPILKEPLTDGIMQIPAIADGNLTTAFETDQYAENVILIGAVSFNKGHPISGRLDEAAAKLRVVFDDGEETLTLRNGRELTTVFATLGSSRINPIADNAPRFAELSYDLNFESYVINRLEFKLGEKRRIKRVEISAQNGYTLLTYGCFVK